MPLIERRRPPIELFARQTQIDFVTRRRIAYAFSAVMLVTSVAALAVRGLNLGIDFTGGTLLEVGYAKPIDLGNVRSSLEHGGFNRIVVQHFGSASDVLIRLPPIDKGNRAGAGDRVMQALRADTSASPQLRRVEFVGPQVGQQLVEDGGLAMLIALGGILIYIWMRFERRLALGAVAATVHDPLAVFGFFALTGMEFDLTVLAAILAVIGYSVNDTIVVFDRIRDNFRRMRRATPSEVVNASVNQTLSRTIMTSGTTLLVVIALLLVGGPLLRGFSTALFIGIVVGTYSSIYVASASAIDLGLNRTDLTPVPKETGERDARP